MKRADLIFAVLKVPVDYAALLLAAAVSYWIRVSGPIEAIRPAQFETALPFGRFFVLGAIVALVWLAVFALVGLYRITTRTRLWEEFTQIVIGVSAAEMTLIGFLFLRGEPFESRFLVLVVWLFAIIFVSVGRFLVRALQRYIVGRYGVGAHTVLVVGDDDIARVIIHEIQDRPDLGYRMAQHMAHVDVVAIQRKIERTGIDDVIVASPVYDRGTMLELVDVCEEMRVGFRYVPSLLQASTMNVRMDAFGGVPLVEVRRTPLEGWGRVWKRIFDVVVGVALLVISLPLFAIVALIVLLDSNGPVIVRLKRVTRGEVFHLLKFRSMVDGAHALRDDLLPFNERADGPLFKMSNDPRVTRVGRWLRKYRIDEFPQLWNVIRGDMSLVGPRPHEREEIERYARHHKKVLLIKPGITGLAQVSGASDLSFDEEVKLDSYYMENWSLWLDVRLLLKTVFVMFHPHETA